MPLILEQNKYLNNVSVSSGIYVYVILLNLSKQNCYVLYLFNQRHPTNKNRLFTK